MNSSQKPSFMIRLPPFDASPKFGCSSVWMYSWTRISHVAQRSRRSASEIAPWAGVDIGNSVLPTSAVWDRTRGPSSAKKKPELIVSGKVGPVVALGDEPRLDGFGERRFALGRAVLVEAVVDCLVWASLSVSMIQSARSSGNGSGPPGRWRPGD